MAIAPAVKKRYASWRRSLGEPIHDDAPAPVNALPPFSLPKPPAREGRPKEKRSASERSRSADHARDPSAPDYAAAALAMDTAAPISAAAPVRSVPSSAASSAPAGATPGSSTPTATPRAAVPSRSFQIVGFDVLVDDERMPHLIEINHNPSLNVLDDTGEICPVDLEVKRAVLGDALRLCMLHNGCEDVSPDVSALSSMCWRPILGDAPSPDEPKSDAVAPAAAAAAAEPDPIAREPKSPPPLQPPENRHGHEDPSPTAAGGGHDRPALPEIPISSSADGDDEPRTAAETSGEPEGSRPIAILPAVHRPDATNTPAERATSPQGHAANREP